MEENPKPTRLVPVNDTLDVGKPTRLVPVGDVDESGIPRIDVDRLLSGQPVTTTSGVTGGITRAVTPYMAGALLGAAAGTPVGGVGAFPGALMGIGAVGFSKFLGDPLTIGVNKVFGTELTTPTEALNLFFDKLGVERPDTATEQLVSILAEGAASGPVRAGVSPMQQMASGVMSVAAGETARMGVESMGAGPGTQLAASVLAGGITGVATAPRTTRIDTPLRQYNRSEIPTTLEELSELTKKASRGDQAAKIQLATIAASGIDPETYLAARQLGLENYLTPGQLTVSKAFREFEETMAAFPDSAISNPRIEAVRQAGIEAHNVLRYLSGTTLDSGDVASISLRTRTYLNNLQERLKKQGDDAYAELNKKIPLTLRNPANNVLSYLEQQMVNLGGRTDANGNLIVPKPQKTKQGLVYSMPDGFERLSGIEQEMYKKLRPTPRLNANGQIYFEQPTYGQLDQLRKAIGRRIDNPSNFADEDFRNNRILYDVLTEDQGNFVRRAGVDVRDWETAKQYVKLRKGVEDNMMLLFGKKLDETFTDSMTAATQGLSRGNVANFNKMIQAIPKTMRRQVIAGSLISLFSKLARDEGFDFKSYAQWYNGVKRNKPAYNAIFGSLPQEVRTGMDNLAIVGQTIMEKTPKHRAYVRSTIENTNSLINRLMYTAANAAGIVLLQNGIAGIARTNAASYSAAYGITGALQATKKNNVFNQANRLIGSPEFLNLVRTMANGEPLEQSITSLSRSQIMISYARAAGISTRQEDIRQWIEDSFTFNQQMIEQNEANQNNAGTQN
jgi:hypothetical protein